MHFSFKILVIIILSPFLFLYTQTDSLNIQKEDIVNDILDEQSEENENEDLTETIEYLLNNPVNINSADIISLQKIPFIDLSTANLIINFRNIYGNYFSPSELYSIKDIPKELIEKIIPFVTVSPKNIIENIYDDKYTSGSSFLRNIKINYRSRLINDLQERSGFSSGKYEGSSYKIYNRMIVKYSDNYQAGFVIEKDAGENSMTDFSSFHFLIKDLGFINKSVIGDYNLEFGQGLALWSPYGFSKSADATYPAKKKAAGIKQFTSTDENNFFRGIALGSRFNNLNFSLFYSQNKFDANIDTLSGIFLSRPIDGLHRTEGEISRKKKGIEKFWGTSVDYSINNILKTGVLYYNTSFNNVFEPEEIFGLRGKEFNYYSFFYDIVYNNLSFFGEFSFDGTSVASINGMQIAFSRNFSFVTSIRNYPHNYKNLHGFGFGEKSGAASNEFGVYTGIKWRTFLGTINFYYDQFKFPYSPSFASSGDELMFDLASKPFPSFETRLRYKLELKDVSSSNEISKIVTIRKRQSSRIEYTHNFSRSIRLKGRFEYNTFEIKEPALFEDGLLFFQEIKFIPVSGLSCYARVILFRTESFNSAVYEYENDLTGVLSNFAMHGEGMRWYSAVSYKPVKNINISMKYSETYKPREKSLSSGNSQIDGNLDNRISFQVEINL